MMRSRYSTQFNVCLWDKLTYLDTNITQEEYPEDFEARDDDKFNYRYRGMSQINPRFVDFLVPDDSVSQGENHIEMLSSA